MYRLSRRFRRRFGKDKEEKKDKHALDYVIVLLDGSDLSFNLDVSICDYCSICDLLVVNKLLTDTFRMTWEFRCWNTPYGHANFVKFLILYYIKAVSLL